MTLILGSIQYSRVLCPVKCYPGTWLHCHDQCMLCVCQGSLTIHSKVVVEAEGGRGISSGTVFECIFLITIQVEANASINDIASSTHLDYSTINPYGSAYYPQVPQ